MKKFISGSLAIVLAVAFSSFTTVNKPFAAYWFPLNPAGTQITTLTILKAGHSTSPCSGGPTTYCEAQLNDTQFVDNGNGTITANSSTPPSGAPKLKKP